MREVIEGDGVAYLAAAPLADDVAVVTSLPDRTEVGMALPAWRTWFVGAAEAACRAVSDDAIAVFYQSDVLDDGRWIDKGHLVHEAADRAGAACVFHKIVCRAPAGRATPGRPAFSHLLGFSRALRVDDACATPDVLPRLGAMTWRRAMGVAACEATCRFLLEHTRCRVVLDPFCGVGTMLAIAEAHGLGAVGVELSPRRAARARVLQIASGREDAAAAEVRPLPAR